MKKPPYYYIAFVIILTASFLISGPPVYAQQIEVAPVAPSSVQRGIEQTPKTQPLLLPTEMQKKTEQIKLKETGQPVSVQPATEQPVTVQKSSAETVSTFEQFIAGEPISEVLTNIRQFGYDLFKDPSPAFLPSADVPVGPDYIIGPGDEIKITVWGKIEGTWDVTVDRDGNIALPKVGVLGVTGLTFNQLRELLYKELSKYYTGFEMNVSMGALRTMRVYVVGNAQNPGAYTVSALSTIVNALLQSGGPSKTGTMRDIQLKRNGQTTEHFDLYDLLLKGDKSKDARLLPEDVIFIPPVGPLAGVAGNVKNPAIYEMSGETRLLDIVHMAGGLSSFAFQGRVQVVRIENHQFRTIFEGDFFNLENNAEKNFILQDGDLIKVFAVVESKNTVNLAGAVTNTGEYGITPGVTKIKDVISLAGGLLYYASSEAELTRVRVTPSGPVTEQKTFDIKKALAEDPQYNIPLEINDYLFVRTVPDWKLYRTVTIDGEVKFPGTYTITKGEKLSSLIERAGGYTDRAYIRGAVFTRNSVKELQEKALVEMAERLESELLSSGSLQVSTALSSEEVEAKKVELEQRKKFVDLMKQVKANGRMSIRLAHPRLLKNSDYDIELEDGDSLFIPIKNSVVNVAGAVMSRGSFIYSRDLDYKDYVNMAGGYSRYADDDNVYVLKVDGTAMKLSNGFFNWNMTKSRWEVDNFGDEAGQIEPGDTVIVPVEVERIAWLREVKDLTQIMYQIAVTAGVAITLF